MYIKKTNFSVSMITNAYIRKNRKNTFRPLKCAGIISQIVKEHNKHLIDIRLINSESPSFCIFNTVVTNVNFLIIIVQIFTSSIN